MNAPTETKPPGADFLRHAVLVFRQEMGQPLGLWALVAALNFLTQIIFRRELNQGEFGTLNTALGFIGLMTVPILAMDQAFTSYVTHPSGAEPNPRLESLRASALLVTETFAWCWGGICLLLLLPVLPLFDLPRFPLQLFTLMNVLVALGAVVSWTACRTSGQFRLWAWLLALAVLARVLLALGLGSQEPWAESGLAVFLLAGFILLIPILRQPSTEFPLRIKTCRSILDRDFLLYLGATISVFLALFLFSSADRIVAQSWFGVATDNNMGLVDWAKFDAYQTAGLLGRGLLWGTQPLLWILFAQRSLQDRTRAASLTFFWIYLGALVLGAILLIILANPLSWIFCGPNFAATAFFVPRFACAMVPLGILQALGIFSLASRRYPECFVLGACSVGYAFLLYFVGRQPELMPAYMFGGGLVAMMAVLFVGVVRWGRKQP
jgi:hypothetical protein